jgi:hypothetical protein
MRLKIEPNNKIVGILLRAGLASVLLYAAISSLVTPGDWVGYLARFMTEHVSGTMLLYVFSAYELFLAVWLLSGKYRQLAALVSVGTFTGIVITNTGVLAITFRDFTMVFTALGLLFLE